MENRSLKDWKFVECGNQTPMEPEAIRLTHLMNKSQLACLFAMRQLSKTGKLYFWTFTFKEVFNDQIAASRCGHFLTRLKKRFGFFSGVRVFEIHPGGHGLHCHLIMNRRLPAAEVWRIAGKTGLGRVDVVKVVPGTEMDSALYLAKYLSKGGDKLMKGVRALGIIHLSTRVRSIEVLSEAAIACKWLWRKKKAVGMRPSYRELVTCRLMGVASLNLA